MSRISQTIHDLFPIINNCDLFHHLNDEKLATLFNGIQTHIDDIPKGKLYAQRGEPLESLIVLLNGELSADILNIEGQILKVENLKAPTLVAAGLLFANQNFLPVQLTAISPAKILRIPRNDLLILAARDSQILKKLLTDSGNKIHFLAEKIRFMQMSTIEKKLCSYIWEQYNIQAKDQISLPYSIQSLSELFGVSRPSLSRSLSLLVSEGLILRERKQIKIIDPLLLHDRCLPD